jgi:hypothetical protein
MSWTNSSVSLLLDHGECLRNVRDCHLQNPRPPGKSQYFNSNGPLQVKTFSWGVKNEDLHMFGTSFSLFQVACSKGLVPNKLKNRKEIFYL